LHPTGPEHVRAPLPPAKPHVTGLQDNFAGTLPDPLALESGRRRIHARIDARFTMAPPRRWTILVTRSDEK
ncbi:hypothetical protein ACFV3F_38210, partial [Streptomyces sp. NPDC059717]